jgi:hypothetical protein
VKHRVKTTVKMISGSDADFLGFYDEQIILWLLIFVRNNPVFFPYFTKIKIQSSLFFLIANEKIRVHLMGRCVLYAGKYSNTFADSDKNYSHIFSVAPNNFHQ